MGRILGGAHDQPWGELREMFARGGGAYKQAFMGSRTPSGVREGGPSLWVCVHDRPS